MPGLSVPGQEKRSFMIARIVIGVALTVVAVTSQRSALGRYLTGLFGRPSLRAGQVLAWR